MRNTLGKPPILVSHVCAHAPTLDALISVLLGETLYVTDNQRNTMIHDASTVRTDKFAAISKP